MTFRYPYGCLVHLIHVEVPSRRGTKCNCKVPCEQKLRRCTGTSNPFSFLTRSVTTVLLTKNTLVDGLIVSVKFSSVRRFFIKMFFFLIFNAPGGFFFFFVVLFSRWLTCSGRIRRIHMTYFGLLEDSRPLVVTQSGVQVP